MEITYKMKCCNCGKEMIYIKDEEVEENSFLFQMRAKAEQRAINRKNIKRVK